LYRDDGAHGNGQLEYRRRGADEACEMRRHIGLLLRFNA
jgi:hypothetical protein